MKPVLIFIDGENNCPKIEDFSAVKRRLKAVRDEENKSFY